MDSVTMCLKFVVVRGLTVPGLQRAPEVEYLLKETIKRYYHSIPLSFRHMLFSLIKCYSNGSVLQPDYNNAPKCGSNKFCLEKGQEDVFKNRIKQPMLELMRSL